MPIHSRDGTRHAIRQKPVQYCKLHITSCPCRKHLFAICGTYIRECSAHGPICTECTSPTCKKEKNSLRSSQRREQNTTRYFIRTKEKRVLPHYTPWWKGSEISMALLRSRECSLVVTYRLDIGKTLRMLLAVKVGT